MRLSRTMEHLRRNAPLLGATALAALGLAAAHPAQAQTTLSTLAQSTTPEDSIASWGVVDTSAFGQTFTTPTASVLKDFTFYIGDDPGGTPIQYKAYVYAWDGSKAVGPALYSSGAKTYNATAAFTPVLTKTGSTVLTAGQKYVAFLTTAGLQTGRPDSAAGWAITDNFASAYSGGDFVYSNTGNNFGALTASAWDSPGAANGSGYDAKFKMDFTPLPGAGAAPEPSPLMALAFTGLGLAGLTLKARRRGDPTA